MALHIVTRFYRRPRRHVRSVAWLSVPREGWLTYRQVDADNYWRVSVQGVGYIQLIKRVGGTETVVATTRVSLTSTTEVMVLVQGNRHRVRVDGVVRIDTTDSALYLATATKVGIGSKNARSMATHDDFYGQGLI